jgi:DEAD/DEAH box helicase domain-containing protein
MSSSQVVLDLETKRTFDEAGGRKPADLGITVVGTYLYKTGEYLVFEENQLSDLEQLLSETARIIGFNIRRFDFPVLQPCFKRLNLSDIGYFDLLEDLEKILGHRVSLQSLAKATLNEGKSGSGLDAIEFYRRGEMEKLKKYCLDDVRLTKEIYEFGKKFGHVYYHSRDKATRLEAKVNWKDPEVPANLSLF